MEFCIFISVRGHKFLPLQLGLQEQCILNKKKKNGNNCTFEQGLGLYVFMVANPKLDWHDVWISSPQMCFSNFSNDLAGLLQCLLTRKENEWKRKFISSRKPRHSKVGI